MQGDFALNGLLGWHKLSIVFNDLKGDILHTSIPTFAESIATALEAMGSHTFINN